MNKGRPKGTVKYLHPIYNDPIGVYEYRRVVSFLNELSRSKNRGIKNKRGRPFRSFKYRDDNGNLISVYKWRRTSKEGKKSLRSFYIKNKYGITLSQYDEMLIKQGGLCWICKKPFTKEFKAHIDHDHKTDKIRGLLCLHCNHLLGNSKDNISILENAINYLKNSL